MEWLKGFLYFSKAQLRATILLCFLIGLAVGAPRLYLMLFPPDFALTNEWRNEIYRYMADSSSAPGRQPEDASPVPFADVAEENLQKTKPLSLFAFNPNLITVEEWKRLGFSQKQAEAIEKIKSKGFVFKTAEDLRRINIIGDAGYERLKDYVVLPQPEDKKAQTRELVSSPERAKVHINYADSAEIERLPGIGPYYGKKILKFRDALGGFASVEQIAEVRNLPDSVFQKIKDRVVVGADEVKKLKVNSAPADTLSRHPYITLRQAQMIVAFRHAHGNFAQLEEVQRAGLFTDSVFQKLKPYLSVE
jgi:competence ComEA-like helix-hairpin-helix protein